MFSSLISKRGMEFYLETAYWEDVLFTEISLIISHHFNVLSEGKKMVQQLSLGGQPLWVLLPPLRQATVQRSLPVTCTTQPTREAIMPTALCGQGSFLLPRTWHFLPSSPLNKSCSSSLRMLCKLQLFPFSGWLLSIIMKMLYQILIYRG